MRYCIAMYDKDDFPYMVFEDYKECAKFLKTSSATIRCNISRKTKRTYKGGQYILYKIELDENDIEIKKGTPNLHIGAILEVLDI